MKKDADFLSRMPRDIDTIIKDCTRQLSRLEVTSAISSISAQMRGSNSWISSITTETDTMDHFMNPPGISLRAMDRDHLRQTQKDDPIIGRVLDFKHQDSHPRRHELRGEHPKVCSLLHEWKRLFIDDDGILYEVWQIK